MIMSFKTEILHKSIQNNKENKFWSMVITKKMFALKYVKHSKITNQASVATEAGKRLTTK